MSPVRHFSSLVFVLIFVLCLAACGQKPPFETSILPVPDESPTSFASANETVTPLPTSAPSASDTAVATLGASETPTLIPATATVEVIATELVSATAELTPIINSTSPFTETSTPGASPTVTSTIAVSSTLLTQTPTLTLLNQTPTVSATLGTTTPSAATTPCFGSINGQVVDDVNGNGQLDSGEGGVRGAILFLRNTSGIVGLYNTGSGEFSFPGLMAGEYNLSETTPPDYHAEGSTTFDLQIECGATVTQNFFNINANQTPVPTFTPTQAFQSTPTPRAWLAPTRAPTASASGGPKNPASPATGFAAFAAGPTYYITGCGTINASGLYRLTTSLVSQWDCIQINNENVIFDCQGNSLDGTDLNGYGIVVHHIGFFGARPRNIEIRNCRMTRHRYGIFVDAADNLYIHDNVTSGNFNDVDGRHYGVFLGLVEGGGIRVNDTHGALLTNNRADNQAIALDIRNSSGVILRGNSANGNSAWGIHFYNVKYSEISSNVSSNNLRYCTWGSGVVGPGCDAGGIMLQSGSSFNLISGNTISGSNGNGIFIKAHGTPCGDGNTIANNRIVGTLYNGIELSFCQNNRLQGNEISNSLDGIWMGFAANNEVDAGNFLHDMSNHGIISWNSQGNSISNNRIGNSREALYFYSSDYDRQQFYFVPGEPADHVSRGNCLCANALMNNTAAAFHLANSIKNQMVNNTLTNNGTNFLFEGNTSGNVIRDNVIQGGTYDFEIERAEPAAFRAPAALGLTNPELSVYDVNGNPLSPEEMLRALQTISPEESFDLSWFKYKLLASLGIPAAPIEPRFSPGELFSILGFSGADTPSRGQGLP